MARILDDTLEDDKGRVKKDGMIYQQRNDTDYKSEYEKLDTKGKLQFFKDYYLQTIVVVLAALVIGGYYLVGALTKPQTVLYIAVIDDVFDESKLEKLEEAVGTYIGLDNKHEVVEINANFNSSNGTLNQQLQSYLYAGSCDIVIAPKKAFEGVANAGYFLEPDTSDTVAIYKQQPDKNRFYCTLVDGEQIRGEKEMDDTEYNFGVSIAGTAKYKTLGGFKKTAIVGISNSSHRQEEAAAFLQFMLDDSVEFGDVNPDFVAEEDE